MIAEFKSEKFYWEIIRILARAILIVITTTLEDYKFAKGISACLIIVILIVLQDKIKPWALKDSHIMGKNILLILKRKGPSLYR